MPGNLFNLPIHSPIVLPYWE